jgi:hypothetical protein
MRKHVIEAMSGVTRAKMKMIVGLGEVQIEICALKVKVVNEVEGENEREAGLPYVKTKVVVPNVMRVGIDQRKRRKRKAEVVTVIVQNVLVRIPVSKNPIQRVIGFVLHLKVHHGPKTFL